MTKLIQSEALFCYDGSFEGFLTLVFKAYVMHAIPSDIQEESFAQPALGQEVIDVSTEFALAERVKVGVCNKAGYGVFKRVEKAFVSCERGRERVLFAYISMAVEKGRKAVSDPTDDVVLHVERLSCKVDNEAEYMRQFVRFQLMENGVYVATVNPSCDVLPLVMGHFVERYNTQPFMIYDEVHHLAAAYDTRKVSYLRTDEAPALPARMEGEEAYRLLWKTFYDSISNEQRFNPDIRRGHMPKRFWKNLTEMQMAVSGGSVQRAS